MKEKVTAEYFNSSILIFKVETVNFFCLFVWLLQNLEALTEYNYANGKVTWHKKRQQESLFIVTWI